MWVADGSAAGDGTAAASSTSRTFPRPRGATPRGQAWDYEVGVWVPVEGEAAVPSQVEDGRQAEDAGEVEDGDANGEEPMAKRAATAAAMDMAAAANAGGGGTSAVS